MTNQDRISMARRISRTDTRTSVRAKVCETVARGFDPPLPLSDLGLPAPAHPWRACRKEHCRSVH